MTNKERYKRAFSTLHASETISMDGDIMKTKKNAYMKKVLAACAAAAVVFGSMSIAYAADLGGIQQIVTAWFHGKQTEVKVTDNGNGNYSYTYTDEDGNVREGGGGGIAIDENGKQVPLSADEVLTEVGNEVARDKEGKVWIYYYDLKAEVTNLFDEDGICRAVLTYNGKKVYFKIYENSDTKETGSYAFDTAEEEPSDADRYTPVN